MLIWCQICGSNPLTPRENACFTSEAYSRRFRVRVLARREEGRGRYPSKSCHTIVRNSLGTPFHASFRSSERSTDSSERTERNFRFRRFSRPSSPSSEGLGGGAE